MAIPGPGSALSLDTIGSEFSASGATRPHGLSEFYRGGTYVSNYTANNAVPQSGTIAIGDFYGASNRNVYTVTIAANTTNYNAYTQRTPSYFAGKTDVTFLINPGVVISSPSTPAPAFQVPSQFNAGDTVTVINRGTIIGRGGNGGAGGDSTANAHNNGSNGGNGGAAMQIARPVTINNSQGIMYGGGGGGGGGGAARTPSFFSPPPGYTPGIFYPSSHAGGGGGGGGRGGSTGGGGGPASGGNNSNGGAGNAGNIPANGTAGGGGSAPSPWGGGTATAAGGGNGGGAGANGSGGGTSPASPAGQRSGGTAGNAGAYLQGTNYSTFTSPTGTRTGNTTAT